MRVAAASVLVLLAAAAPAAAQGPQDDFFDARAGERAAVQAAGDESARPPTRRTRRARRALERALGPEGVVDIDALTGTPRMLARLDGTLTGPRAGDPAEIAQRYVRENLAALGLTTADLGSFGGLRRVPVGDDATQVRWRQYHAGVPALDNELRVTVTADGEVLNVLGSPQHDLEPAAEAPRLGAAAALRAAGARSVPPVVSGPAGPRRETAFRGGDRAELVIFGEGDAARLAWRILHRESSREIWEVAVDARTGRLLRRVNMVKQLSPATMFERHPGAPDTGSFDFVEDPDGWLDESGWLSGPHAHAWSDVDDSPDDVPGAGEDVAPDVYPAPAGAETWDPSDPDSWKLDSNRERGTMQAFYYVNRFHDWLRAEVGFADFEGTDRVLVQTFDGADIQDPDHLNNANMYTPAAGEPPVMQLYLFAGPSFRNVHGGDDGAIVYHEYAHGLTSRLVTYGHGSQALNAPQAAAMGEGFSDYYAMDYLVSNDFQADDPGESGELDLGEYTNGGERIREQAIDCPVGADAPSCPGGGLTFGDYAKVIGYQQIHADGEIWAQTLWDLREALTPEHARQLVTTALALAPTEPSFLDMRNAILQAHQGDDTPVWEVFRVRGMGYRASTLGPADQHVVEDFSAVSLDGPRGTVAGGVTSADSGLPLAGSIVRVGGHDSVPRSGGLYDETFLARSGSTGAFSLRELPAGPYPQVTAGGAEGHDSLTRSTTVVGSSTASLQFALARNWAAASGGAAIAARSGGFYSGCGPAEAIDQNALSGASADQDPDDPPWFVVRLAAPATVTGFGLDPGATCGDPLPAATREYRLETSPTGQAGSWTPVPVGPFAPADANRRNHRQLSSPRPNVRYVRLTLVRALGAGSPYIDFTELSVYGRGPNVLPSGPLVATPGRAAPRQTVTFDARGVTDPDSRITAYDWDFDGNGTVDRTTAAATTSFAYGRAGTYRPRVGVRDFRGGSGIAGATVVVTAPELPPPPPPPPPPELGDPEVTLPRSGRRGRVRVRVTCEAACWATLKLNVNRSTARRLRLGRSRTVGRKVVRLDAAGSRRITVKLSRKVVRRMKRAGVRRVKARIVADVRDDGGRRERVRRTLRVRR